MLRKVVLAELALSACCRAARSSRWLSCNFWFSFRACRAASLAFASAIRDRRSETRMTARIIPKKVISITETTRKLSFTKSVTVTFSSEASYMGSAPVSMEAGIVRRVLFRIDIRTVSCCPTAKAVLPGCIRETM